MNQRVIFITAVIASTIMLTALVIHLREDGTSHDKDDD